MTGGLVIHDPQMRFFRRARRSSTTKNPIAAQRPHHLTAFRRYPPGPGSLRLRSRPRAQNPTPGCILEHRLQSPHHFGRFRLSFSTSEPIGAQQREGAGAPTAYLREDCRGNAAGHRCLEAGQRLPATRAQLCRKRVQRVSRAAARSPPDSSPGCRMQHRFPPASNPPEAGAMGSFCRVAQNQTPPAPTLLPPQSAAPGALPQTHSSAPPRQSPADCACLLSSDPGCRFSAP